MPSILVLSTFGLFAGAALPAAIIDARSMRIPTWLSGAALVVWSVYRVAVLRAPWIFVVSGALLAALLLAAVRLATRGRLGMGDVKYGVALGALLGPAGWIFATFAAAVCGLMWIGAGAAFVGRPFDAALPFAPFLGAGAAACLCLELAGPQIFSSMLWPFGC